MLKLSHGSLLRRLRVKSGQLLIFTAHHSCQSQFSNSSLLCGPCHYSAGSHHLHIFVSESVCDVYAAVLV